MFLLKNLFLLKVEHLFFLKVKKKLFLFSLRSILEVVRPRLSSTDNLWLKTFSASELGKMMGKAKFKFLEQQNFYLKFQYFIDFREIFLFYFFCVPHLGTSISFSQCNASLTFHLVSSARIRNHDLSVASLLP